MEVSSGYSERLNKPGRTVLGRLASFAGQKQSTGEIIYEEGAQPVFTKDGQRFIEQGLPHAPENMILRVVVSPLKPSD